jgi:hypothetical protein
MASAAVPLIEWRRWVAAAAVTAVAAALVIADITVARFRHWWAAHALTTNTVTGLLVLAITVLVVNQVVRRRQERDRSRAVAAQAAILMSQARRSARTVTAVLDGSGDRDAASDELRTYMIMLLVGGPVLIEGRISRNFLEQAQHLAAELARALAAPAKAKGAPATGHGPHLDDAIKRLSAASAPLLQQLTPDEREAASGGPSS